MAETPLPGPREFNTTHWSLIGAARSNEADHTEVRDALEKLCRAYWYPTYAFVRSRGYGWFDAQDLTQTFLARFVETGGFASADRDRGRFRTYLLGALKHFLANEWHRSRTQKRGGQMRFLEWDALDPEARYALGPKQSTNPERRFDREWACELTARTMEILREEMESRGKGKLFTVLRGCLTGEEPDKTAAMTRLQLSEGALKVAVHRLRKRYRDLLRSEIADTVQNPAEIDEEMRYLVRALRETL